MIKKICISLFVLLGLLLALLIFVVTTNMGLRWSIALAKNFIPGQLTIQQLSGKLIGPLSISGFRYQEPSTSIYINTLTFNWQPSALFAGELKITKLNAKHIHIKLTDSKKRINKQHQQSQPANRYSKLSLPLTLNLQNIHLTNVSVQSNTAKPIKIADVTANANTEKQQLNADLAITLLQPQPLNAKIKLTGLINQYQLSATAKSKLFNIRLQGHGNQQQFTINQLTGSALDGKVNAHGTVQWSPQLTWQSTLNAQRLNVAKVWPNETGQLSFILQGQGSEKHAGEINLQHLQGHLHGQKVSGGLKFHYQQQHIKNLLAKINIGNANIKVKGHATQQWQLSWLIHVPNLALILPDATGSFTSQGQIHGAIKRPSIQAKLNATNLYLYQFSSKKLLADMNINAAGHEQSRLNIHSEALQWRHQQFNKLDINAKGDINKHQANVNLKNKTAQLQLSFTGSWSGQNKVWQGNLSQLTLNQKDLGTWHLKQHVPITLSETAGNIPSIFCLINDNQRLCLQAKWQQDYWSSKIAMKNFQLANLNPFINKHAKIQGNINLNAQAQGQADKITQATLHAQVSPGKLTYNAVKNNQQFAFQGGSIQANINKKGLQAHTDMKLIANSQFTAKVNLPKFTGKLTPKQKINAQVTWQVPSLEFLNKFSEHVTKVKGEINATTSVKGTVNKPKVHGQLALTHGQFNVPVGNLQIRDLKFTAKGNGHVIDYQAQAKSGGLLQISGRTELTKNGYPTQFKITGKNVQVSNTTQYEIYLNPKLNLTLKQKRLDLNGTITIPKAKINPPNYRKTVTMPEDVQYVEYKKHKKKSPFAIYSHIKLIIGNDVYLSYIGASGKLAGSLSITDEAGHSTTAVGHINLLNGRYTTYGQQLELNPATLAYSGSLITNPSLNIHAYRRIRLSGVSGPLSFEKQFLLTGITVTGTANNPKVGFFSDPSGLSQTDILSYLILGRPAAKAGNEADLLLQAALALSSGTGGGSGFMGKMQKSLGIEITTEKVQSGVGPNATQSSAVALGKYLMPHLFISYGVSLIGGVNILRLRYNLNKYLSLQTENSTLGNSADLLLNFERN